MSFGKHLPYEKSPSMYVSKFICDEKIDYNFVEKNLKFVYYNLFNIKYYYEKTTSFINFFTYV